MSKHRYRKKPVVIEAFQMTKDRSYVGDEWPIWLNEAWRRPRGSAGSLQKVDEPGCTSFEIVALEGVHRVTWGDWIIRGVKGELYPCKPDIFEATYDKVTE